MFRQFVPADDDIPRIDTDVSELVVRKNLQQISFMPNKK